MRLGECAAPPFNSSVVWSKFYSSPRRVPHPANFYFSFVRLFRSKREWVIHGGCCGGAPWPCIRAMNCLITSGFCCIIAAIMGFWAA